MTVSAVPPGTDGLGWTKRTPVVVVGTFPAARRWAEKHRVSWRRVLVLDCDAALYRLRGMGLVHVIVLPGHEHLAIGGLWDALEVHGNLRLVAHDPPIPDLPDPDAVAATADEVFRAAAQVAEEFAASIRLSSETFTRAMLALEEKYADAPAVEADR